MGRAETKAALPSGSRTPASVPQYAQAAGPSKPAQEGARSGPASENAEQPWDLGDGSGPGSEEDAERPSAPRSGQGAASRAASLDAVHELLAPGRIELGSVGAPRAQRLDGSAREREWERPDASRSW